MTALLAAPAPAGEAIVLQDLDRADRLMASLDFKQAMEAYESAVTAGNAPRSALVRAFAGLAQAASFVGQQDRAVWAFERLLALEPGWLPPAGSSPRIADTFERARRFWVGRDPPRLSVEVPASAIAAAPLYVQARMTSDPLTWVAGYRL